MKTGPFYVMKQTIRIERKANKITLIKPKISKKNNQIKKFIIILHYMES